MKKEIKLEAVIDLENGVTMIKPIYGAWEDFGYWLEALSMMMETARKTNGMTREQAIEYATSYLRKAEYKTPEVV